MRKLGGVVTHMQQNLINEKQLENLTAVKFLVGDMNDLVGERPKSLMPFCDQVIEFLNSLSKNLMSSKEAKQYPDIITLGFWIRKSSLLQLKDRFHKEDENALRMGRGIAFHIAPSNVPVNYAYSLVTGLLTGNVNIVRIPSKDFPQVDIVNRAIAKTLDECAELKKYIYLVRYDRNQKVNDVFSVICDSRIIWGGDQTISEIRKSPLSPRAGEITFADRYSLAIINSDKYLSLASKERFAEEFYNDTYLTDQNACTSPRIVVWIGEKVEEAKDEFWKLLHNLVEKKYTLQPIMGVNKLTSSYIAAAAGVCDRIEVHEDNYIVRVHVKEPDSSIMELKDNSGYFFECECHDLMELRDLCNNNHCQTIGYLGERDEIMPLLLSGIQGVDRVVPIGKTMDFDLLWDGYDLYERLTRNISISI